MLIFRKLIFLFTFIFIPTILFAGDLKPKIKKSELAPVATKAEGYLAFISKSAVIGFQIFISPVDGDRCRMKPTCSVYSRNALREYGFGKGLMLTFDRLLHEGNEFMVSPIIIENGRLRTSDPLVNNTFWWRKKGE